MTDELSVDDALAQVEREKAARVAEAAQHEHAKAQELANAPDAEERAREARLLAGTPVGFAKMVLGLNPYPWQAEVLTWFEDTTELVKGSLATPNGAGKSAMIDTALALWWISVHPQGRVVITTKDSKQLDNQVWPAIERHKDKFPAFDFIERMVRNGTGGFIIGFTTDDPGRAEGWHKIDDFNGPLLIICDEAKSIPDAIHMALDRCTYNAKLLTSSPGLTEGLFYRSQTEPSMGFLSKRVGLKECPHIPQSRIDNIIQTYGPDHWFTRSTLYAEFTDADSDTIFAIPKHVVRDAMEHPPRYVHGGKRAFCDFAAGGDENTFTLKTGNKIEQEYWRDPNPMSAVARFVSLFVKHGLKPSEIQGDAGGMGLAIIPRFAELDWPIQGINNESTAIDPTRYPSLAAEDWHEGAVKLASGRYILPDDPVLFSQLTSRRAEPTSDGILGIESKREMKKRGVSSPDRADGVLRVLAVETDAAKTLFDETGMRRIEDKSRAVTCERGRLDMIDDVVTYEAGARDSWLDIYERPVSRYSYICVVNPVRHSERLESNVIMVVRSGYFDDAEQKQVPSKMVAKVRKPNRLDAKPLARMTRILSTWYGRCRVVPIVNDRGDVIDAFVDAGLQLYVRENTEVFRQGRTEKLMFGWESDKYTRSQWIGAVSDAVVTDQIEVGDVETVMQLFQLSSSNAERMKDAEALGVALKLENYATQYAKAKPSIRFSEDRAARPSGMARSMIS